MEENTNDQSKKLIPLKNPNRKQNFSFDYIFSEIELQEKGKQLSRTCATKLATEDEKKSVMSNFKDRLDATQSEINMLSRHINEGKEFITKTCNVEYDYDKCIKTFTHEGKVVGTEKMTQADYQLEAEFGEEKI